MNNEKILTGFIKCLKIGNSFLESISSASPKEDSVKRYELVDKKHRHVYEKEVGTDNVFEALTKYSTTSENGKDSFVLKSHALDDNFKLMVVAEGKGFVDGENGIKRSTSKCVTDEIIDWFDNLSMDTLERFDTAKFSKGLNKRMAKLHAKFKSLKGNHGVKAILALVGKDYTYLVNVGDLRCYIEKDGEIGQFNEEDSKLWRDYREGYFWDKEEFRFRKVKNRGVSKIGVNKPGFQSTYVIDNCSYDRIYLFSRGVIDCISEDKLFLINERVDASRVVEEIVKQSTDGKKEYMSYYEGDYRDLNSVVHGYKDATACVYVKQKKK